jgi:sporulation protein YlmC with PRC-barrel domain
MKKANKIGKKIHSNWAIATLCMATAGWMTAQAQDSGANQPQTSQHAANQQTAQQAAQIQNGHGTMGETGQPQRINKCSDLIGTTVENQQGDKLGKIDEVVVDFQNGKVAYCVMTVEHKIFSTPKYLAIPLSAFQPSADGDRLILNADKDKVAQAQGFDRNSWPAMNNAAWGAQPFWQPCAKDQIKTGQQEPSNKDQYNSATPAPSSH